MPTEAKKPRVYSMPFANVYPLYVEKVRKKGRSQGELDQVIFWLTGYDETGLARLLRAGIDIESFFAQAPCMNPRASLITGVVCGVCVEEITDPVMRNIRCLDKLVDELARGKDLTRILR